MTDTKLQLRSEGRDLVLDGPGIHAVLRKKGLSARHAVIEAGGTSLPVEITDRRRRGVQLGAPDPVLRLARDNSFVPDGAGPVGWEIKPRFKGYHGIVTRGADRVEVFMPRFHRTPEVRVAGRWGQLELVVLSACFALLSRRQRDTAIATAASG